MNMAELRSFNDKELDERRLALQQEINMINLVEQERLRSTGDNKVWKHKRGVW